MTCILAPEWGKAKKGDVSSLPMSHPLGSQKGRFSPQFSSSNSLTMGKIIMALKRAVLSILTEFHKVSQPRQLYLSCENHKTYISLSYFQTAGTTNPFKTKPKITRVNVAPKSDCLLLILDMLLFLLYHIEG
jgi:hypothetical protein